MSESKKAIDVFSIREIEAMGRAAYLDEQRIEQLREVGIPNRAPWAVALCDQLASGFMFISAQWRKPTQQDIFATRQRVEGLQQSLRRELDFEQRLLSRKQIADMTSAAATDAERAAVEALLKSGRANPIAIASEPERLSIEVAKHHDTTSRDAAIADDADLATFYPSLREHDEGLSFVASERTKIVFESATDDGGGERTIIIDAGDSFKMNRDGNFTITRAGGESSTGVAKRIDPAGAMALASGVISDAAEAARRIEDGGQIAGAMSIGSTNVVELTFVNRDVLRMTAEAFHAARAMIESKAGFLPLTPAGIDAAIRQNGRVAEAKLLGASMVILKFENGERITVPAEAWDHWGSSETALAAAGGVQASEQASEAAGSDPGANAEAGGGVSAAVQAADPPVRMDGGGRSA